MGAATPVSVAPARRIGRVGGKKNIKEWTISMEIKKELNGSTMNVKLIGRLDAVTARDLDREINNSLGGVKELVFDLAELSYVASAGLRVLFVAQKKMNKQGSMKLRNVRPEVKQIFEVTRFIDFFTIES